MPLAPPTRRILLAAAFLALVAALALLPPYINGERYRHRIADAMGQSLGRPVHIDTVSFHLLPTAGITLGGLVVDENPAFGNEPVIRANVVEATLRLSSLWRRQIEISRLSFGVDANGSGPSVNIVRNAAGRWNLQDILMQAAHANTAPTTQPRHGTAPRFPYIEATGARVNLKLGDEKMPFSLTEADFALWLPEPQQWHIRLTAKPSRTDTNTSDTGNITLEGTLGRAATLADVPLALTASWAHAPLGEATRVLTGADQQWRGMLDTGATLTGTVGAAQLDTTVHLTELRRADFVPADLLDISAHCTAAADLTAVLLTNANCTIPTGGPQPLTVTSTTVNLQSPASAPLTVTAHQLPAEWPLDWARLITQQIPDMHLTGDLNSELHHTPPADGDPQTWQGSLDATLTSIVRNDVTTDLAAKPVTLHLQVRPAPPLTLDLGPMPLQLTAYTPATNPAPMSEAATGKKSNRVILSEAPQGAKSKDPEAARATTRSISLFAADPSQLTLTASADTAAITLHFTGTATADQLRTFGASLFTPLGDALANAAAASTPAPTPIDITCTHPYTTIFTCQSTPVAPPKPRIHHHR